MALQQVLCHLSETVLTLGGQWGTGEEIQGNKVNPYASGVGSRGINACSGVAANMHVSSRTHQPEE